MHQPKSVGRKSDSAGTSLIRLMKTLDFGKERRAEDARGGKDCDPWLATLGLRL